MARLREIHSEQKTEEYNTLTEEELDLQAAELDAEGPVEQMIHAVQRATESGAQTMETNRQQITLQAEKAINGPEKVR